MNLIRKVTLIVGRSHLEQKIIKNILFKENDVFGNVLYITPNDPVYMRNRIADKYGIVYLFDIDISFNSNDDFLRYFSDLFSEFPAVRFVIPTSNAVTVELFNVMLKKWNLRKVDFDDFDDDFNDDLKNVYPLNSEDVAVYTYNKNKIINLMDYEEGVTGNTLIDDFNDSAAKFERLGDLQDEL